MYYILYEINNKKTWELVSGEDAMQIRIDELVNKLGIDADDIVVFDSEDELR